MSKRLTEDEIDQCAMRLTKPGFTYSNNEIVKLLRTLSADDAREIALMIVVIRQVHNERDTMQKQFRKQFDQLLHATGTPDDDQALERLKQRGLVTVRDYGTVVFRAPGPQAAANQNQGSLGERL